MRRKMARRGSVRQMWDDIGRGVISEGGGGSMISRNEGVGLGNQGLSLARFKSGREPWALMADVFWMLAGFQSRHLIFTSRLPSNAQHWATSPWFPRIGHVRTPSNMNHGSS